MAMAVVPVSTENSLLVNYCATYKGHYDFYCADVKNYDVMKLFCENYNDVCIDKLSTTLITEDDLPPTWSEIIDYCTKDKVSYANLCFVNYIQPIARKFCTAYFKICPGTPRITDFSDVQRDFSTEPADGNQRIVNWPSINAYCNKSKGAFWKLCMSSENSKAETFCKAYSNICLGSPDKSISYTKPQDHNNHSGLTINPKFENGMTVSQEAIWHQPDLVIVSDNLQNQANNEQKTAVYSDGNNNNPLSQDKFSQMLDTIGMNPLKNLGHPAEADNSDNLSFLNRPQEGGLGYNEGFGAPFFDMNKGTNVIPTKSATTSERYNIAGMKIGGYSNVDWSGTPGLGAVNDMMPQAQFSNNPTAFGGMNIPGLGNIGGKKK